MNRQNPFTRSTNDRYGNNRPNGGQNNCNDPQPCCCDDDKDKNPCVVCPPSPQGPRGPAGPEAPSVRKGQEVLSVPKDKEAKRGYPVRKDLSARKDLRDSPEACSATLIFTP